MDIKKLAPWNWFKKEEEDAGSIVPVHQGRRREHGHPVHHPATRLHAEIDRIFESAFRDFGMSPFGFNRSILSREAEEILKPTLDIGATEKAYTISVEIPGVDEKDVRLELSGDALFIRGEKRQEKEEKEKNFYRVERSYGSFQRTLSLPGDADRDGIQAGFRKGVLTITVPRRPMPESEVRRIEVRRAD